MHRGIVMLRQKEDIFDFLRCGFVQASCANATVLAFSPAFGRFLYSTLIFAFTAFTAIIEYSLIGAAFSNSGQISEHSKLHRCKLP